MITEFLRDQAFTIAWFGLMAFVWFGWAQEDPVDRTRGLLGVASGLGILLATVFGILVWRNWETPTALDNGFWVFGWAFIAMTGFIIVGSLFLAVRKQQRWFGWWIALCVGLHFIPLVWVFDDWSYLILAVVQIGGLMVMFPRLRDNEYATSRWAGPWVGGTFLMYSVVSAGLFLVRYGYPV